MDAIISAYHREADAAHFVASVRLGDARYAVAKPRSCPKSRSGALLLRVLQRELLEIELPLDHSQYAVVDHAVALQAHDRFASSL